MNDGTTAYNPGTGVSPCKDCQDRTPPDCHGRCERYQAYRAWRTARSEEIRQENASLGASIETGKRIREYTRRHKRR